MSLEVKIHDAQVLILRELLFRESATYATLQKPTALTSDHFSFHIKRLNDLGFVDKVKPGVYKLSAKGKEYANKLDTDSNTIERQPKIAVILAIKKVHDGAVQYVFQERLKNPYYGFWGFPTGKIRWGETVVEAAKRESIEETGIDVDFVVKGVYHEHVTLDESKTIVEDKIFFVCEAVSLSDELQEDFEGGRNKWMTIGEMTRQEKKFASYKTEADILSSKDWLIESSLRYTKEHF